MGYFSSFKNVRIYPYVELLDNPRGGSFHRGGPLWPDWDHCHDVRQQRFGKPIDHRPYAQDAAPQKVESKKLAWCGPVCGHFGHQLADFSSRILAYQDFSDLYYCFATRVNSGVKTLEDCPPFFRAILQFFRVPEERVVIVHEPIVARALVCSRQMEQVGVGPKKSYLDLLSQNEDKKGFEPRAVGGRYFVSRAGMAAKFAGESCLEHCFTQAGFKVIRPEVLSLTEQLNIYRSAKTLVFSEGSALHALQLLGDVGADVHVLERRPGARLAIKLLRPRCSSLTYHDIGRLVFGLNVAGDPAPELGINVPDKEKVRDFFDKIGGGVDRDSLDMLQSLVDADLKRWVVREMASRRGGAKAREVIESSMAELRGGGGDAGFF